MTTTRDYEALVIFKAAGTEQDIARSAAHLEEPIKKVGGSIESSQSMGRRKLAFRIARHSEGHYYLLRFRVPTAQIGELERLFRLHEAVVRFMILTADDATASAAGPARQAAEAMAQPTPSRPVATSTRS